MCPQQTSRAVLGSCPGLSSEHKFRTAWAPGLLVLRRAEVRIVGAEALILKSHIIWCYEINSIILYCF